MTSIKRVFKGFVYVVFSGLADFAERVSDMVAEPEAKKAR